MNRNGYQYSYEREVEILCHGLKNAIAKGGKPKTAKTAATRAYKLLCKKAAQYGMNPDCEVGKKDKSKCYSCAIRSSNIYEPSQEL